MVVTSRTASHFANTRIDARALLGLSNPNDRDWGQIRAAQLNAANSSALLRFAVNVVAAALLALVFAPTLPSWVVGAWIATMLGAQLVIVIKRLARRNEQARNISPGQIRGPVIEAVILALIWSIPALGLASVATPEQTLGLWIILSTIMAASAIAFAGIPLATVSFVGVLGLSICVTLAFSAQPLLVVAVVAFTGALIYGCLLRGHSLATMRMDEIAIDERDETVSLLLREFEDHGADWLWEIDSARRVTHASPRFAHALGHPAADLNGKPILELLAGETWEAGNFSAGLRAFAEKLKSREAFRDILLPVKVNGEERWWELSASPRIDARGNFLGLRGVGSDVTEARQSADKINRMARFDTLTGLPNRLMIHETLARAMSEAEQWGSRSAFFMIDLDRFKAVNDTLGHPVGDRLLSRVSERLAQIMSDNELCGRLGGDEFAVVVRDASDSTRLEMLAHRIIETLSRPYEVDQHTLYIGASVGVAVAPRDGRTAETLIRSSDLALYRSKDAGGGVFHAYEPQLHVQAEERRILEISLRQALKRGEMHLNYQPIVSAEDGSLEGFETLLRWTHPELGVVSPAKFIPVAEDARLIAPIGEWVLRTACEEATRWPNHTRVSVNVSAEQLHDPNFVKTVVSAMANSGLPAHRLELEVTESVFLREGTGAVQVLEQILDLGVRLALDDFGTGYSSLGYLSRTRFSTIKIDRSFVSGAAKKVPECLAIIRAVVALAGSLGMATTAEGVEDEAEYEMIRALGCTKVQGYYFGRPLPTEEARGLACRDRGREAA